KAHVRWVSPLTGKEEVLQCCKTDCNGMKSAQLIGSRQVPTIAEGSVAALQGGEGAQHPRPLLGLAVAGEGEERFPPSPVSNTATLSSAVPVSHSEPMPSGDFGPLQSELQHSAIPSSGDCAQEVF